MIKTFSKNNQSISVYGTADSPYFKAREIALLLGYRNPTKAIRDHVEASDKKLPCELFVPSPNIDQKTIFINESGLYSLILSSKLPKAKDFQRWITSEVLPEIRKKGIYVDKTITQKIKLKIETESDLQKNVVNYLRSRYPDLYFIAPLGEMQDTSEKRIKAYELGYSKGSPDLLIFHRNKKFAGLAIEFKSPNGTGSLSSAQEARLLVLRNQKWDVIVSNNLFEIIERIYAHMNQYQIPKNRRKKLIKPSLYNGSILDYLE